MHAALKQTPRPPLYLVSDGVHDAVPEELLADHTPNQLLPLVSVHAGDYGRTWWRARLGAVLLAAGGTGQFRAPGSRRAGP